MPIVPLDALTRPDFRPDAVEFDVKLGTNKRNNVFAPDDELEIIVANPSPKDVFIELIGTSARGEKVILAPNTTRVRAGQQYRFPPEGAIKVRGGLGKERITVFASTTEFPRASCCGARMSWTGSSTASRPPPIGTPGS